MGSPTGSVSKLNESELSLPAAALPVSRALQKVLDAPPSDDEWEHLRPYQNSEQSQRALDARAASQAKLKAMSPQDRAKARLEKKLDKVVDKFLDACLGQRNFEGLDKKTQAALLVKAMEWGIGRPNTGKPIVEPKPEEEPDTGIAFE